MSKKIFLPAFGVFLLSGTLLYGQTAKPAVKEIRYGIHSDKTRMVVELSGKCKKNGSSGCGYSLSQNKNKGTFTLDVKGVSYKAVNPKGEYGKEIRNIIISPVSGGIKIFGWLNGKGGTIVNPSYSPNLIVLDIFKKFGKDVSSETIQEEEYKEEENSQKLDLLALRYGSHPDRTRVVVDLSDACVWEETAFSDSFIIQIKGATSKISGSSGKKGNEVKKVEISSSKDGKTTIKVDKGKAGGDVQVQLLDSPYRMVIDVFSLKSGDTQKQRDSDVTDRKKSVSSDGEDLNEYAELLPQPTNKADDEITEEDKKSVKKVSVLTKKQKAGKRIIVIDPGHGGKFDGTYFTVRKFIRYENQIQYKKNKKGEYVYKTVNGKKQKVPLKKTVVRNGIKRTENITKKVAVYKNIKTFKEHEITLVQAKAIKAYFDKQRKSPFKVILTRTTNKHLGQTLGADLAYRGEVAIKNNADAFISIHINASADSYRECSKAQGFEIMYRSTGKGDKGRLDTLQGKTQQEKKKDKEKQLNAKKEGKSLAGIISSQMRKKGLTQNKPPNVDKELGNQQSIVVLRIARYPAILIETGYICNEKDRKSFENTTENDKIAEAIYKGLMEYGRKNNWF